MNYSTDDELISAYLDGELSGDELLRAERMVAEHPEYRQLVDELRAIGGGLRDLPRHKLDDDFADRVLRRAEREMLAAVPPEIAPPAISRQPVTPSEAATSATAGQANVQSVKSPVAGMPTQPSRAYDEGGADFQPDLMSWNRWRRPVVWSSLAVAAALLIMFLGSPQMQVWQAKNQLAQGPAPNSTSDLDRSKESASRSADGSETGERFSHFKGAGGPNRANEITAVPSISSTGGISAGGAQKPAAESLAKNADETVPDRTWSMKSTTSLNLGSNGVSPNGIGGDEKTRYLNFARDGYQRDGAKRLEDNAKFYNYFALQPDGQTSPAQPLTDDVLIVQCNVDSVDAANRALRELLTKQQIAWDKLPAASAEGAVSDEIHRGAAKAAARRDSDGDVEGGGGLGGGGFRSRGAGVQNFAEAAPALANHAMTAKPGELAESETDVPSAAAEFGFLREIEELGINRRLDRTQLGRERSDRERLDRAGLVRDKSGADESDRKNGKEFGAESVDGARLTGQKASQAGEGQQNFRKAVLVEGSSAQVDALIADMTAQKGLVHEVVLRYAAGTPSNEAAKSVSPENAVPQGVSAGGVAAGSVKLGEASLQKQSPLKGSFGVGHDFSDSVPLGGVPAAVPVERPSPTPAASPMSHNKPMLAPQAPAANAPPAPAVGNPVEAGKKADADNPANGVPANVANETKGAEASGDRAAKDSASRRTDLRQKPSGHAPSSKSAPNQAVPPRPPSPTKSAPDHRSESARPQRGAARPQETRQYKGKSESSPAPASAPAPAAVPPARPATSTPPTSRTLAEPPPGAEKMAEGKLAPSAPVEAKAAPAPSEPAPSEPAPTEHAVIEHAVIDPMPRERPKSIDPTPPKVAAPAGSTSAYRLPKAERDPSQAAAPQEAAPAEPASQAQSVQNTNSWYGRAQEVIVPAAALGQTESAQQQPRFNASDLATNKPGVTEESHDALFSKAPSNQAVDDAPERAAEKVELKTIAQDAEKSEPSSTERNAAVKPEMRSGDANARGRSVDAIEPKGEARKETVDQQSRGVQLPLKTGGQSGDNKPLSEIQAGDSRSSSEKPSDPKWGGKIQERFGEQRVEKKLSDGRYRSKSDALDATAGQFHDSAPQQVATTPPTPRRVIFVFNVQPPTAAAAPVTEIAPEVRAAPAKAE